MNTFSTAAWVAHDLGLAAGFGGALFGKLALHPAVRAMGSREERGKVVSEAWKNHRWVSLLSTAAAAGSWVAGRTLVSGGVSGRGLGRAVRPLVITKDVLVGAMVGTHVATAIVGAVLSHEAPDGSIPLESGGQPASSTPPRTRRLLRAVGLLGDVNLLATAGVIGVTALLAMRSGRSLAFALRSHLLP